MGPRLSFPDNIHRVASRSSSEPLVALCSGAAVPSSFWMPEVITLSLRVNQDTTLKNSVQVQVPSSPSLGLSGSFPHHLIQIIPRWWSVDLTAALFNISDDTTTKLIIALAQGFLEPAALMNVIMVQRSLWMVSGKPHSITHVKCAAADQTITSRRLLEDQVLW